MPTISKGNWYKLLFQRIDKAIADGFFLEATFIISGIIDDRLKSTITILDPAYSTRETIGEKCKRIRRFNVSVKWAKKKPLPKLISNSFLDFAEIRSR